MCRLALTSLILLITAYNIGLVSAAIKAQAYINQGEYNIEEDATLICAISNDQPLSLALKMAWYKKQDGVFILMGRHENTFVEPFKETTNKYHLAMEMKGYDEATFNLSIFGVGAVDTGDYKCELDELGVKTDSNVVSLLVNPDSETTHLSFKTNAPETDVGHFFNDSYEITCSANAQTKSSSMALIIKMKDGTDITQDFKPDSSREWTGSEGLKVPSIFHKLEVKSWQPEKAGNEEIACVYSDGDKQLAIQTLLVYKLETATVSCSTNYKRAVRADDNDVIIMCQVHNYKGSKDNTYLSWSFIDEETSNNSTLITGPGSDHIRVTEIDKDEYRLRIPKVTEQMASTGNSFLYTVKFYSEVGEERTDIASTEFHLPLDGTRKITSDDDDNEAATVTSCIGSLLILSILQLMVAN